MAGYNTIRGLRVKYLSADPANSEMDRYGIILLQVIYVLMV